VVGVGSEGVLLDVGEFDVVSVCTATDSEVVVRTATGPFVNVVSDSRNVHVTQTILAGDEVTIGDDTGGSIDRGDFDLGNADGLTLTGSFHTVFAGDHCQTVISGITSQATASRSGKGAASNVTPVKRSNARHRRTRTHHK
jgi:hypothetical protein